MAGENGNTECVKVLLTQKDINVNAQITGWDNKGYTPLHLAVEQGQTECVKLLLTHPNINTNIKDNRGKTPLALAQESLFIIINKQEIIDILKLHGATYL